MPLVAAHELDQDLGNIHIYNGLDCCATFGVFDQLETMIPQAEPLYSFERALQGPVLEMTMRGFRVNPGAREIGMQTLRRRLDRLSHIIDKYALALWDKVAPKSKLVTYSKPKHLNPESRTQLIDIFYNHLGVPPIIKHVRGEETMPMDRETLEKIEVYFQARPLANAIMEYRDTVAQLEVFESEVDDDWRMRTTLQIAGTDTTRFSSSKSITGSGRNLQNIEEGLRYIFVSDPGYKLYGIDLEQAESREVGLICGLLFDDWSYLDIVESGDEHTTVARIVWEDELPWTGNLKEDRLIADTIFYRTDSYRQAAKVLGHGTKYLGKPPTMSMHTKIPLPLIKAFQQKYFAAFPCLLRYHHWVASQLQRHHRLTNIFGVTRDFFDRADDDATIRAAVAFLPQSATAQRMNLGMWRLWRGFAEAELLCQVHDAIYFQVKDSIPESEVARRALPLIEIPQQLPNGRRFVVPGEIKVGLNWGPRKEDKKTGLIVNDEGLRKVEYKLAA